MVGAFKSYDIRGIFGTEWTAETAYQVGRCLPTVLEARRVLVGRDVRLSSPEIRDALIRGLVEAGCSVDDMGLATTPMVYFFTAEDHYDASIQITASHNPPEYNGLKVSKRDALPVGYDAGLNRVETMILTQALPSPAAQPGSVRLIDNTERYLQMLLARKPDLSGLRFAVDCSNGMCSLIARQLFGADTIYLNATPDGTFPAHQPNPLEVENCQQLSQTVIENHLDLGVIFDGDADRVMFVDEQGTFIQPDYMIPLIAHALDDGSSHTVIHDIRTSRGVIEALHEAGFQTVMGKVGHAYAKVALRETHALCGGELAGHYYFRDFHFCDSGELAALIVLGQVAAAKRAGKPFSALLNPIRTRYANSGEINFKGIEDKPAAIQRLSQALEATFGAPTECFTFDGIRMEYPFGWINVRPSNTEPCLRFLAEADTHERLSQIITLAHQLLAKR